VSPRRATLVVGGSIVVVESLPLRGVNSSECEGCVSIHESVPTETTATPIRSIELPVQPLPTLSPVEETVTVQRIIRPLPPRAQPPPQKQKPKTVVAPNRPRDVPPPAQAALAVLPAYVDPRPNVPHERSEKAHDFEYHREGKYAARNNARTKDTYMAPVGPNRYGGAPIMNGPIVNNDAPIVPSDYDRAFTHAPNAVGGIDPRPALSIEKEKAHDYEVHRESNYAMGHTAVGAHPAVGIRPVRAGPTGAAYSRDNQPVA